MNTQTIAVELNGIGYVLTAYIPSDFMEKIEDGMIELGKKKFML